MFIRLEAIESRGVELSLPSWVPGLSGRARAIPAAPPAFARRPAMWLLVKKELRLQQLTFAVSGLYVMGWVSLLAFGPFAPASRTTLLFMLTVFHSGAIPLLAGSLASAEERHLGTLEWQTLLPMARWKQWVDESSRRPRHRVDLDAGVYPRCSTTSVQHRRCGARRAAARHIGWAVILVVVASLYISSVCTNGLQALLISGAGGLRRGGTHEPVSRPLVLGAVDVVVVEVLVFPGCIASRTRNIWCELQSSTWCGWTCSRSWSTPAPLACCCGTR